MANKLSSIQRIFFLSRAIVVGAYVGKVLFFPILIMAVFGGLVGLDVFSHLPGWLHTIGIFLLLALFCETLRRGLFKNQFPRTQDIFREIEKASGYSHRPFETLADVVPSNRSMNKNLWRIHQIRTQNQLKTLRIPTFERNFPREKALPFAVAFLFLLIGLIAGWGQLSDRLDVALSPDFMGTGMARNTTLDVWITPPDYTALPPIILSRKDLSAVKTLEIPVGSRIEARVGGGSARPHIIINDKREKFSKIDRHNFQTSQTAISGNRLKITQGWRTLGMWPVSIIPNTSPVISWTNPPSANERNEVKIQYTASDQYGITKVQAEIHLADEVKQQMLPKGTALDHPGSDQIIIDLPSLAGTPKSLETTATQDWTGNPWAGFPVHISLSITGATGLSTKSSDELFVLPEKKFLNPTAKALIAERKRLILDPLGERVTAAGKLAEIANHPEAYNEDKTLFLILHTAAIRLWKDASLAELDTVQDMMWQVAIQLEYGASSETQKNLAAAEAALKEALQNNASPEQIDKLTADLKQALNQYLAEMQRDLQRRIARGEPVPMVPPGMEGSVASRGDLDNLIEKMRQSAANGNHDAAENMLSDLQNFMNNLHNLQASPPNAKSMQAWDAIHRLETLTEQQQKLLDKTFRRGTSDTPQAKDTTGAEEQNRLKSDLQSIQKQLSDLGAELPNGFKEAQTNMGNAAKNLEQSQFQDAAKEQTEALAKLRDGLKSLADQIAKQNQNLMLGNGGAGGGLGQHDPLGRSTSDVDDPKVKVPDESYQQRAREILQELRKRSGDRDRAKEERDYIDRVLKTY